MSKDSVLEKWLRENCMSTQSLVKDVGCSRTIIWKVKNGLPICKEFANKIIEITGGRVRPIVSDRGKDQL